MYEYETHKYKKMNAYELAEYVISFPIGTVITFGEISQDFDITSENELETDDIEYFYGIQCFRGDMDNWVCIIDAWGGHQPSICSIIPNWNNEKQQNEFNFSCFHEIKELIYQYLEDYNLGGYIAVELIPEQSNETRILRVVGPDEI